MKGIVFEVIGKKAVIMKNSGEFVTVPWNPQWRIGDVVEVKRQARASFRKALGAAACLFLVFLAGMKGYGSYMEEECVLSIDVNPSLELGLNRFDRVVSIYALNRDGKALASQVSIKNKKYKDALEILLKQQEQSGYFREDTYVAFTVYTESSSREAQILNILREEIGEEILSRHSGATVECYGVSEDLWEEAHHYGVSVGKYKAILELKEAEPDIEIEDYCHRGLGEIKDLLSSSLLKSQTDLDAASEKKPEEAASKEEVPEQPEETIPEEAEGRMGCKQAAATEMPEEVQEEAGEHQYRHGHGHGSGHE